MAPPPPSPPCRPQAIRVPLAGRLPVADAVLWLREDRHPFALAGDWLEGLTVLGSEPLRTADPGSDPFETLDEQPDVEPGEALVGGGWVGWLGYGLGARIERLPPPPPAPVPRPPFSLAFYDHVVVFDGEGWWFEALPSPARDHALEDRLAIWRHRMQTAPTAAHPPAPTPFQLTGSGAAGHLAAVADCHRRIVAGELYQANLCLRLQAEYDGDPVELFSRALPEAMPRFGALVDGAVSLSPERFLRRRGRTVWTEPIKGTRPRSATKPSGREELLASGKDAAEHVMIVDLMRNDLGRVCAYGTVEAHPPRVEAHSGVWHLVSKVSGELRRDATESALLRATFPPGSVTGAPKVQAMKVIATLESTRREVYTGAIGLASPIAGLDLSVAIRTFELQGTTIWFGAGGGIVADSDPELELQEALAKAAGPIAAIGGHTAPVVRPRHPARSNAARPALAHGHRPDPTQGVFETVLVVDGRLQELEPHLARLAVSLAELYGSELDPATADRAHEAASAPSRHRLRILADPDGATTITLEPAAHPPRAPVTLAPFVLPGGLGAHKWRDRSLLEALAAHRPGTTPLLLDGDGAVLEAGYANVWIIEGDRLITPPADGRILPGVTRARILSDEASAREEPIDLERLAGADAIFLTSSISLRHPAELPG